MGHDRTPARARWRKQAQEALGHGGADGAGRPRLLQRRGDPEVRAGRDQRAGAQAAHLEQQGRRAASTSATSSTIAKRRSSTDARPGERAIWRFTHDRERHDDPQVLVLGLPADARSKRNARPATTGASRAGSTKQVLERCRARLDRMPQAGRLRRQTVEHAFGTLKAWMGATHFLTKTLPRVRTEMSLHVLAYNLKRVMQIFGVKPLIAAMRGVTRAYASSSVRAISRLVPAFSHGLDRGRPPLIRRSPSARARSFATKVRSKAGMVRITNGALISA